MSSKQTLFITGASGYIGSVLTSIAIEQGYTVNALSRSESSDAKLKALGATPVRGDISAHDVLIREAGNADTVINIADAIAGNYAMSPEERIRINNGAIGALVEGLKGSGKKFIITSGSLHAAADPEGKETDEDSPMDLSKPWVTGGEQYALQLGKENGIKVMAVRLAPYVYGRGGSGVKLFMQMFKPAGTAFYVSPGTARITTVHVDDAARLYLLIAEKGKAGEIYNATDETNVTQKELAEAIGKVMGLGLKEQSFEETKGKMGDFLATFLRSENRASNKKAKRDLGWVTKAEKGILQEVVSGSYVTVAEEIVKGGV